MEVGDSALISSIVGTEGTGVRVVGGKDMHDKLQV